MFLHNKPQEVFPHTFDPGLCPPLSPFRWGQGSHIIGPADMSQVPTMVCVVSLLLSGRMSSARYEFGLPSRELLPLYF